MPVSILAQLFLPQSAVKLGRFVTNVNEPHRDYYDSNTSRNFSIVEKVEMEMDYDGVDTLTNHRNFAFELTSFLSSSFSRRAKTSIRITTGQVKTYYLDNNGQWFRNTVQSEDVRMWIERTIDEGEDIYVVVGYHTILDAHIAEQSGEQRDFGGKVVLPTSAAMAAMAAAGVVVPFGNIADHGLAGASGRTEDQHRQFVARGERIIAVQYRKLRFRWFSSKNVVDKATLAKETQWKRYDRPRYLQSDGEDMVEVELDDDLALEGDCEKYTAESGEIIFSVPDLDITEE
jgi:hypothetical protein